METASAAPAGSFRFRYNAQPKETLLNRFNLDAFSLREPGERIEQIAVQIEHLGFKLTRPLREILIHFEVGIHLRGSDQLAVIVAPKRSEERRVGKEGR